jgi:hypothetical protein
MSNRKKPKNSFLTRRRGSRIKEAPSDLPEFHKVVVPEGEDKEILKIVDATINNQRVGDAILYTDGTVDIRVDDDADPELLDVLQGAISDEISAKEQ